ncbi:hypothetical protein A5784_35200 [Mycobacterium sp. 852013-50091_SCH5140682]|uniref:DUF7257 domain-containing protein n=1 Tax=Mycobacterium sp. 852013-50091_SCH5140682 TaxID=1834109 RepID=UPI0007EAA10E|nr:hypothetical protein [Mycobacterium sp. 852013-50091_SCH5140682]OBC11445.1 hypothetical protein A5784_35200 [Mycobacterium sp. 852013-50091_SCH5140682]
MSAGFGGSPYTNPQTRALNSIANGPDADTTSQEKMVELLQRHSSQLKYLAANQKQMQQGINDANANPIQQIQEFIADVIVLLGGGQLAKGALDFGDLQYILPALGALFGLGDGPFPVSLFEAAERFFLGYVVPQQQFVDVINSIITAWAGVFGIDPQFVADVRKLLEAFGNLFDGINNLFPSLDQLFKALGISGGDLGPLGQVLAPIIKLFSGIDLTKFGSFIEFITDAIDPFIVQLTAVINFVNGVLAVLGYDGGDVVNSPLPSLLQPFQNLLAFLANINFFGDDFDPVAAVRQFVSTMLLPLNLLLGPDSPLNLANAFGRLSLPQFGGGVPLNALTTAVANELQPFSATSVPNVDGWSFDAAADAAKVICDGTAKNLYLKSGVIKVEQGQPLNTSIKVKYSGVSSTAGQGIRYVLETFTTADGSGPATPVVLGSIPNPTGTISSPVTLGNSSWDIPAGVQSVRPVLTTDALAAGTVYWLNTPLLTKPLLGVLANGLPAAIQARIDDLAALAHQLLTNPAAVIGTITQGMVSGLGDLNTLVNQIRDILAGLVVTPINSTVQAIKDWFTGNLAKTQNITSGGLFDATKLIGLVDPTKVGGVGGATNIGDAVQQAVDAMTQGAGGLVGAGFSFVDALAQLTGLRNAAAGANAAVLNVQSQLAGLDPAASSEIINFSEYVNAGAPPSMFTKVFDQGSGGIVTSGGKLVWSGSAGDERYLFNGGPLQTDLFEVNVVLPTVPSHGWFGADGNNFIYLIGRSDAAGNNMCLAEIGWDRVRILSYNTGTTTVLATVNQSDIVTGGCRVAFKGGNALQPRYFHVAVNDDIVTSATDIAPVTQLGSSFRLCGLGLKKDSSYDTGTISAWSMLDGGASAGSGVVAGMTAAGPTNLIIWKGTAAEYAAIPTKNPNTIYAVKN